MSARGLLRPLKASHFGLGHLNTPPPLVGALGQCTNNALLPLVVIFTLEYKNKQLKICNRSYLKSHLTFH